MATAFVRDGSERVVNTTTAGNQTQPDVTVLEDGSFVVVWKDGLPGGPGDGVFMQRFAADGTPLDTETRVNTVVRDFDRAPTVTAIDSGYVVIWQSERQDGSSYDVYMQRYDLEGVAQGSETRVNTTTTTVQYEANVAGLADGGFVVTWDALDTGSFDVLYQRFDANGIPQGGETRANTTVSGTQYRNNVTALSDGGYIISWAMSDANADGVYFQRYNAAGVAQGGETRANTTEAGPQVFGTVFELPGGGFVVAWQSSQPVPTDYDIYFQRYDADGVALGGEVRANTFLTSNQGSPLITAGDNGGFIVAWSGPGGNGSTLSARAFDASGIAQGDQFSIDAAPASNADPALAATANGFIVVSSTTGSSGDGDSSGIVMGIYAAPVPPVLTGVTASASLDENVSGALIDGDVTFMATDAALNGGRVVVSGLLVEDVVGIRNQGTGAGQIGVSGSNLTFGGSVIGSISGGNGTTLTVTLNATATAASVEALIENLTYSNASATPTASRTLNVNVIDAVGQEITQIGYASANVAPAGPGYNSQVSVALFDFDNDGDLDMVTGDYSGAVTIYRNTDGVYASTDTIANVGNYSSVAIFSSGGTNYLVVSELYDSSTVFVINGDYSFTPTTPAASGAPASFRAYVPHIHFADYDDDGDQDLIMGQADGFINVRRNDGAGVWTEVTIAGITDANFSREASPVFFDFDQDGDLDIVIATSNRAGRAYANNGAGIFTELSGTSNPFLGYDFSTRPILSTADVNGDGLLDLVMGQNEAIGVLLATPSTGIDIVVNVTAANDAPDGNLDTASTDELTSIAIAVLTNDLDADGPAPTIATVNGVVLAVGQSTMLSSGAIVTLNGDGTLGYDPNGAFDYLVTAATAAATAAVNRSVVDAFSYTLVGSTDSVAVQVTVNGVTGPGDELHGDAGNNSLTGTPDPDYFDLSQGGNDTATGGGSNDAFLMGAEFDALDTIDGNDGDNDQVGLRGDYSGGNALVLGSTTLRNVELIGLLVDGGNDYDITTHDDNVAAGQTLTVFGTNLDADNDLTFKGSNETDGSFRVYGGAGSDDLTGGAQNDGFWFGPDRFDPTVDRLDGGAGTNDQLALDGNYTITLDGAAIQNIEAITLQRGPVGDSNNFDLTLADSLVADNGRLTIWGYPLLTSLRFDGSAEAGGDLRIYGGAVGDTLIGGGGDDWLWGGYGGDRLEGGAGADVFAYDAVSQSTGINYDTLVGFDASVDRIDLPFAVTSVATAVSGTLSLATFNQDLAAAIGAALLGQGQAVMFTASGGDMDGQTFLIVNGVSGNGYQAGTDYVFHLENPVMPITTPDPFV